MKKIIKIAFVLIIVQNSLAFSSYKSTCVLPYYWDKKGNLLVLLGQERTSNGYVWSDFCGRKESKDKNSYAAAISEAKEETGGQLKIRHLKEKPFFYNDQSISTIHYILPVCYVSTEAINAAVQEIRSKGKGRNREKTGWQWVKAEDLIHERTNLKLAKSFTKTLQSKPFRNYLKKLLAQRPLILLKKTSTMSTRVPKRCKKTGKAICTCPR